MKSKVLRNACKVPKSVTFLKKWELADELLQGIGYRLPHAWVTSDSEFGRCEEWRDRLNGRLERYLLDVPCNTSFHISLKGVCLGGTWQVSEYAATMQLKGWTRFEVRKTANGIKYVDAFMEPIFTDKPDGTLRREILVVIRTVEKTREIKFLLSNAPSNTSLGNFLKVSDQHWLIEDCFKRAKGEVGLDQYEVRSMLIRLVPNWGFSPRRLRAAPRPSVVERVVGRRRHRGSDAEQALERVEREEPPVESERELVQVRLKVLRRDTVVDAIQPGF